MLPNVVEVQGNDRYLCKERGFIAVYANKERVGRIPLDDLHMVLLTGHGITLSNSVITALAERCVPLVTCNASMKPISITLPFEGHHLHSKRMALQVAASLPLKKRLWKQIVSAKISMQAQHLGLLGKRADRLHAMAQKVLSGDADNREGAAAAYYWRHCFSPNFRRQREEPTVNSLLNYCYTILRSGTARALMLSGLHPAFGLFHREGTNSMPLVDDLMEPFRPVADMLVHHLVQRGVATVTSEAKQYLVGVLQTDMGMEDAISPVYQCLRTLCASLAGVFEKSAKQLLLPQRLLPLRDKAASEDEEAEHEHACGVPDYVDAGHV